MIKTHSDDPDVAHAAGVAAGIIEEILGNLPKAGSFDYGGHILKIGEYGVCERCTAPIAEAQAAEQALRAKASELEDETVKEHLTLAADLFQKEAEAAVIRAEFHNGYGTEKILNRLLGYQYDRHIGDDYQHSHHQGA
jgi:hypothetical protein